MTVFDQYAQEYDIWFDENERIYRAELNALRRFIPQSGKGIEVGAGTGCFSIPFEIGIRVEPSHQMAQIAHRRGLAICQAAGERLPWFTQCYVKF